MTADRILIVHDDSLENAKYCRGLATGLLAHGVSVTIATRQPGAEPGREKPEPDTPRVLIDDPGTVAVLEEQGARIHLLPGSEGPSSANSGGEPSASWIAKRCDELDSSLRQVVRREHPLLVVAADQVWLLLRRFGLLAQRGCRQ